MSIIIGTAGHIDHGKTTLIKNITGIDTDRLPEEKKRGMSIDIGFSYLNLNGKKFGIVDVPGHEKFIKNMMDGAAGIDVVILVVAADDGIMPQTREHLDIINLLGIKYGIVVITKCDKVTPARILEVQRQIDKELKVGFLKESEIIETSINNLDSYNRVKTALYNIIKIHNIIEDKKIVFRMSVDRSFNMKGFGTIITGTSQGMNLKVGDILQVYPGNKTFKVRGIQNHGLNVETLSAGNRCALNLAGIDREEIKRGNVVATPNTLSVTKLIDVEIKYLLSNKKTLKNNQRVRFHHGTKEIICRVKLLNKTELVPGEVGYAQLILENKLVAFIGDLGILRSFSPLHTIGGVTILNPLATKSRRFDKSSITKLITGKDDFSIKLSNFIEESSSKYLSLTDIKSNFGSSLNINDLLENLIKTGKVIELTALREYIYIHQNFLEKKKNELVTYLKEFHEQNSLLVGENISAIRNRVFSKNLKNKNFLELLKMLEKRNIIKINSNFISLIEFEIKLDDTQRKIKNKIYDSYNDAKYKPPKYRDLSKITNNSKELKRVFDMMVILGELIFIEKDIFLLKKYYQDLVKVVNILWEAEKDISLSSVKLEIETSRKYLIAYLEHFDRVGFTKRVDDRRILI